MNDKHLFLIGFMATGKSTTGIELARLTGRSFVDLDELIAQKAGMPVPDYLKEHGEKAFRDLEERVLSDWAQETSEPAVMSCGGGVVLRAGNVKVLRDHGVIVRLNASPDTILTRTAHDDGRPLLSTEGSPKDRILELMRERESLYTGAADFTVETDGLSPMEAAGLILEALKQTGHETV